MMIGKMHRISGYLVLFFGNVTIMTGLGHYFDDILQGDDRKVLGLVSLVTFCIFVAMLEGLYRIRNKYALGHIVTPDKI